MNNDLEEENVFMREERVILLGTIRELQAQAQAVYGCSEKEARVLEIEGLHQSLQQEKELVQTLANNIKEIQAKIHEVSLERDALNIEVLELLPLRLKLQKVNDSNAKLTIAVRELAEDVHVIKSERDRLKSEIQDKTKLLESLIESKVMLEKTNIKVTQELQVMVSETLQLQNNQIASIARIKELEKERDELLIQRNFFERKCMSLSREVTRLVSCVPIVNTLEEIKEENNISKMHLRAEAMESLINPNQVTNHEDSEIVADENCFVFLFGVKKKKERRISNIF